MIWNAPSAAIGLLLLAGPVLVHLLVRRLATRLVFPAMRFVPPVRAAAIRLRRPSDLVLLLLRLGIVTAAVLAALEPVLVTSGRRSAWSARVARAVIVDASPSVAGAAAAPLADAEAGGAFVSRRFVSADLHDAIGRANEWLATTSPSRPEISIVSDFQLGAVDAADISAIPANTGVRLIRAGTPSAPAGPLAPVDGWRQARWRPSLTLASGATGVTWQREPGDGADPVTVRAAPADMPAATRAAEAARSFGVPVGDPSRKIEIAFAGAPAATSSAPSTPWIAKAAMALHQSALVAASGAPLVIGERDGGMTVATTLPATSPFAPAVIRAVLLSSGAVVADRERETGAVDEATLSAWRRAPRPSGTGVPPDASDGRWLWALALVLILVEGVIRHRGTPAVAQEVHADAA